MGFIYQFGSFLLASKSLIFFSLKFKLYQLSYSSVVKDGELAACPFGKGPTEKNTMHFVKECK